MYGLRINKLICSGSGSDELAEINYTEFLLIDDTQLVNDLV